MSADEDAIPLAEAIAFYRAEAGFCSTYSTLRGHAASSGSFILARKYPFASGVADGLWNVLILNTGLPPNVAAWASGSRAALGQQWDMDLFDVLVGGLYGAQQPGVSQVFGLEPVRR